MKIKELSFKEAYTSCHLKTLENIENIKIDENTDVIGQEKASEAITFGINMKNDGYNIFCVGIEGNGKKSLAVQLLEKEALKRSVPNDWCYVNNFDFPHKPKAICLPAGKGKSFAKDIEKFIKEAEQALPAVFEDNNYNRQVSAIQERFKNQREAYFESLQGIAKGRKNVAIMRMPSGLVVAPTKDGQILTPEVFDKLPKATRKRILEQMHEAQAELERAVHEVPKWEKDEKEEINRLNSDMTFDAVHGLIQDLLHKYEKISGAVNYIHEMENDIVQNVSLFLDTEADEGEDALTAFIKKSKKSVHILNRYQVNLFVHNAAKKGAPVLLLEHPNLPNLVGRMERKQQFGTLTTDFTLIKSGALHQANGGFLIIDAREICNHPAAWESLKRSLISKKIRIESADEEAGVISTTTLDPEAIPLDIKVVLIGDNDIYYRLSELDKDFHRLFKVEANFYPRLDRKPETEKKYASLILKLGKKYKLKPLSKEAVERLIEYASRIAESSQKLTTRLSMITDIMKESDYFVKKDKNSVISVQNVNDAIAARIGRSDNLYQRTLEHIKNGTLLVKTDGACVGQINILAVHEYGYILFGNAHRMTCQTGVGKGDIIDIERSVDLGGPLHSKGVMILSSFLNAYFAQKEPLCLKASLAIEQSYGPIDGDSASAAELICLLSSLSDTPINQAIAMTGSVNQMGQIQAVGAVNEKIEGYFDVCRTNGLTGKQGVIIPSSNIHCLMLRHDVVEAIKAGAFHIYPVDCIEEALLILTGKQAGARNKKTGKYPKNTLYGKIEERLHSFYKASLK